MMHIITRLYSLSVFTLVVQACEPGINQIAKWLTRDIDLQELPPPGPVTSRATREANSTTLFYNGSITTLTNNDYSLAEALVVRNDVVLFTGNMSDALAVAGTDVQTVNLQGNSLLPGFIEPHVHTILTALAERYLLSLSPLNVTTLDHAVQIISDAISDGKVLNGSWVAGYGYDPSRVDGHPDLTVDILDKISNTTAIYILNQSGHVAYVNTMAFNAANITAASVAGNSNFQQIDGKLTGLLFEQAVQVVAKAVPLPSGRQLIGYCAQTVNEWMARGCTTVFDAGIGSVSGATDLTLMAAIPSMPLRMHGAISGLVAPRLNSSVLKPPPFNLGMVNITSIKFWADGSTQGFTAAVNSPYLNPPTWANPYGLKNYANASILSTAMSTYLDAGFQIVVHSNGDNSTDMVLDAYTHALSTTTSTIDLPHRIEHFTVTNTSQRTRAKSMGLAVSHTIGHVNYWGPTFQDYVLGSSRALVIDPLRNDEDIGLTWSLHSDSPVTPVNPLLYVKTATTREMYPAGASVLDTSPPSETVDLLTALKAITINPATQLGIGSVVGTLEVGKQADFVILDHDIMNVPLDQLDTVQVLQTWIGGLKVCENGTCGSPS